MSLSPQGVIISASACASYCRCMVQRRVASRINAAFELPVKLTNGSICDCPRLVQERCRWVDFGQCRVRFRDAAVAALPPSQRRMLGHAISVSRHTFFDSVPSKYRYSETSSVPGQLAGVSPLARHAVADGMCSFSCKTFRMQDPPVRTGSSILHMRFHSCQCRCASEELFRPKRMISVSMGH